MSANPIPTEAETLPDSNPLLVAWGIAAATKPAPESADAAREEAEYEHWREKNQRLSLLDQLRNRVRSELTRQRRYLKALGRLPSARREKRSEVRSKIGLLKAEECAFTSERASAEHVPTEMD